VASNNGAMIIDKSGNILSQVDNLSSLALNSSQSESLFDPEVYYDQVSGRFFFYFVGVVFGADCSNVGTCPSKIYVAVSKTENPQNFSSADWHFYSMDATLDNEVQTTNWADLPLMTMTEEQLIFSMTMFGPDIPEGRYTKIRLVPKLPLLNGEGVTKWTDLLIQTTEIVRPVMSPTETSPIFLMSRAKGCGFLIWEIVDSLTSPSLLSKDIPAEGLCEEPPPANQLGGPYLLRTSNPNFPRSPVYQDGSIWVAYMIAVGDDSNQTSGIRWAEIDIRNWPSSVSWIQDAVYYEEESSFSYPAITVNSSGDLAIVFQKSSSSEYLSLYFTGRLSSDPLNTLRPATCVRSGQEYLASPTTDEKGNPYLDFIDIALDPSDKSAWMAGSYAFDRYGVGAWTSRMDWETLEDYDQTQIDQVMACQ
jgi:hypothetical protein